jgi:hypothetical protein
VKDEMPDPDSFQIKEEDIKNFENCGDFVNGEFQKCFVIVCFAKN